ncbi:MAG: FKBP-type peptidyl-prolyl cis-trans isomerase, partial [Thermoplasmata archaeon]|nr:FKBP-type peptidyl-prolyl cis-trans isomerase [Thermoplasmata archaeon]
GTFADDGLVFDTSLAAVARDNASYAKAFSFTWRSTWQSLSFTIGKGSVIPGFELGVQGLAVGDAKTLVVPPSLGYGVSDPAKFLVKPVFEPVPVRITMSTSDFAATYHTAAVSGANVTDPFWGWSATVSVSASVVTVANSPVPGQHVRPYGAWDAQVVSIDDGADGGVGRILVHHLLTPGLVDRVGKRDSSGRVTFIVSSVDLVGGTYTLNYNDPTRGRDLVFQVTMLQIHRSY